MVIEIDARLDINTNIQLTPSSIPSKYHQSNKEFSNGKYDEALKLFQELAKLHPGLQCIDLKIAECFFWLEMYHDAYQLYRIIQINFLKSCDGMDTFACILVELGKYDELQK